MDHPRQIGPYAVQEVIGEGGMGTVYRAYQTAPIKRTVAIKVVRSGVGSANILSRFELERQTLALMDHSGVARVYDAGTTEIGVPYFVMELVNGEPITDYCDRHRLSLRDRIKLFLELCSAVQHAHQKGIIHRDLKPSNILVATVDGTPRPKVIDFGIARAVSGTLADRTKVTREGQIIGTPEYMSPEQAGISNQDVDTRSDVYALGVILYELLTGVTPIDLSGAVMGFMIQYLMGEQKILPPSSRVNSLGDSIGEIAECRRTDSDRLRRRLRGDLDWVVMRAIEVERTKRYQTIGDLTADLGRYLRFEPVSASPGNALYRMRKFVRRHRLGVASGVAIVIGVGLGVVGLGIGLNQARLAEREARVEAANAEARVFSYRALDRLRAQNVVAAHVLAIEAAKIAQVEEAQLVLRDAMNRSRPSAVVPQPFLVRHIEFSQDGARFVTAGADSVAYVWSTETGELLDVLDIHTGPVEYVAFVTPDTAATVDRLGVLRSWSVVPSRQVSTMAIGAQGLNTLFNPVVSSDGSRIAIAARGRVRVFERGGPGSPRLDAEDETLYYADFSSDGRLLAGSGGGFDAVPMPGGGHGDAVGERTVFVWDLQSGVKVGRLPGVESLIREIRFAPGDSLVIVSGAEVLLWDFRRGRIVRRFPSSGPRTFLIAPDGERAVSSLRGGTLYDTTDWRPITRLTEQEGNILSGGFSRDGSRFVASAEDGTTRVWRAETGEMEFELGSGRARSKRTVIGPDGRTVLTVLDSLVMVWPLSPQAEVARLAEDRCRNGYGDGCYVMAARFRGDGSRMTVLFSDATWSQWELRGNLDERVGQPARTVYFNDFLPGDSLAVMNADTVVRVVSLESRRIRSELQLSRLPHGVSWSERGDRIAVTVQDGTIVVWDHVIDTSVVVASSTTKQLHDAVLNRDGSKLAVSWSWGYRNGGRPGDSAVVEVRDLTNLTLDTLYAGPGVMRLYGFSYDTNRLLGTVITLGPSDSTYTAVWNVETLDTVAVVRHSGGSRQTFMSPDGRRLLIPNHAGTVNVLDVDRGYQISSLIGHSEGVFLEATFAPDGRTAITSGFDFTGLWDVDTGTRIHTFDEASGNRGVFHPSGTMVALLDRGIHVRVIGSDVFLRFAESELPYGLTEEMRRSIIAGPLVPN